MKILSFDVGIKNLSYCLLNDKVIEDWGILNISTDDVCEHCSKDGKRCDKSVKYVCQGPFQVCSAHKKLKQYSDKKFKCVPKKKNPMLDQGTKMVEILKKKENFIEVDLVVIENQPALKNPTMKSIQMILYTYFLIEGVTNNNSSIESIELINARNKLKAYTGPIVPCDIKDKYKRTKFLGIQYCLSMIIDQQDQWINLFTTSKKKDDLADAYLQGMYVLQSKH
jgi:hypothetical protein